MSFIDYFVLILGILVSFCSIANTFLNRRDKVVKDTKEDTSNNALINYRLDKIEESIKQLLNKFDTSTEQMKKQIEVLVKEEIEKHILEYHNNKGE